MNKLRDNHSVCMFYRMARKPYLPPKPPTDIPRSTTWPLSPDATGLPPHLPVPVGAPALRIDDLTRASRLTATTDSRRYSLITANTSAKSGLRSVRRKEINPGFEDEIRRRAYELYEERGREYGHDLRGLAPSRKRGQKEEDEPLRCRVEVNPTSPEREESFH